MNKEQAKELIPIMQAWVDGKVIQHKGRLATSKWAASTQYSEFEFNPNHFEYRIKPEPQHIWRVSYYNSGSNYYYTDKEIVMKQHSTQISDKQAKLTHFVEVTDE